VQCCPFFHAFFDLVDTAGFPARLYYSFNRNRWRIDIGAQGKVQTVDGASINEAQARTKPTHKIQLPSATIYANLTKKPLDSKCKTNGLTNRSTNQRGNAYV
jgi:hypothetical protein